MTAICGIVRLDGPVDSRDDSETMMNALAHHGPGRVQFFYRRMGRVAHPSLPVISTQNEVRHDRDRLAIVVSSRLDNREDLFRQLGPAEGRQADFTDGDLILLAYEKWEEQCAQFLLGDFAFAIWDGHRGRLFASRDHMGLCPFFYYRDSDRFIFASEPKAIAAVSGINRRVNLNKLAALAFPAARPFFWNESWFEGIYSLPAGTSLVLDGNGFRTQQYWQPQLPARLPFKSDREILEAFRELMFEVVGARLRDDGPVTALLSGGLDSSAIVSVAARVLEKRNQELHALSAVLPSTDDPILRDERLFIDQYRVMPNVRINYVTADARGPFDNLEELVRSCDAPNITSRHYLYTAFAERARELGTRIILDGSGGELGATFHADGYYLELFLGLHWHKLATEMRLRKQMTGGSLRQNLRSGVLNPLIPVWLLDRLRPRPVEDVTFDLQQPLQRQFAERQLADILPMVNVSSRAAARVLPSHLRMQHRLLCSVQRKMTSLGFLGHAQTDLRYPFMDKRLLEFCLSVPGHLKVRDGYKRYLIRAGLDGMLPPLIQWRTDKRPFSPDYYRRYNAQRKHAQTLLEEIGINDPLRAVVDVDKVKQLAALPVHDNEHGSFAESAARDAVPIGVYLICFLRQFDEFRN